MEYRVVYSKRKTISLCIKDCELVVRAPYGTKKQRIESVILSHQDWITKHLEKQRVKSEKYGQLTDENIAALKKTAKELLPQKVAYYANLMGLKYGRITITSAKTRFGSCSSKGNLSFSFRLMLYPEDAIDYVVVHELAHLIEMNHSKNFYKIVGNILPDYKQRIKLLKK